MPTRAAAAKQRKAFSWIHLFKISPSIISSVAPRSVTERCELSSSETTYVIPFLRVKTPPSSISLVNSPSRQWTMWPFRHQCQLYIPENTRRSWCAGRGIGRSARPLSPILRDTPLLEPIPIRWFETGCLNRSFRILWTHEIIICEPDRRSTYFSFGKEAETWAGHSGPGPAPISYGCEDRLRPELILSCFLWLYACRPITVNA
jgi:hypothetical protein